MKKKYVVPAIKAADVVINQIIMTSGGSDPDPIKPESSVDLPFVGQEEEGCAD